MIKHWLLLVRRPCTHVVLFWLLVASSGDAQVKQWVDKNGVTHYEQAPKQEHKSRTVHLPKIDERMPEGEFRKAVIERFEILNAHMVNHKEQIRIFELGWRAAGSGAFPNHDFRTSATGQSAFEALKRTEKVVALRNNGALPQWVKDNRDWRALDKEFSR